MSRTIPRGPDRPEPKSKRPTARRNPANASAEDWAEFFAQSGATLVGRSFNVVDDPLEAGEYFHDKVGEFEKWLRKKGGRR